MPASSFKIDKFVDGVNLDVAATELKDGELRESRNMYAQDGILWSRPLAIRQAAHLNFTFGQTNVYPPPMSVQLFSYRPLEGSRHIFAWVKQPGLQDTLLELNENVTAVYSFDRKVDGDPAPENNFAAGSFVAVVPWRDKLYLFGGQNQGYVLSGAGNDVVSLEKFGVNWPAGDKPKARVAWTHQNSLVLAGFDDDESLIRNTETDDFDTLVTPLKGFRIKGDGPILAGMEVPVYGGANYVESYSIIWRRRSVLMLQGALPTNALDGSVRIVPINEREGLVSPKSIAKTPDGIVWCSGLDVWFMPHGQTPIRIGKQIRKLLEKQTADNPMAWSGIYFDGFYRLSVPDSTAKVNSSCTSEWWCDLRNGPDRVAWWGPMTIPSASYLTLDFNVGGESLFGAAVYPDDINHRVIFYVMPRELTLASASITNETNFEESFDHIIRFKEFDFGDYDLRKLIERIELTAWASQNINLTVKFRLDGGSSEVEAASLPITGAGKFVLDTSRLNESRLAMPFTVLAKRPSAGGSRVIAHSVQPVVQYTPNIFVPGTRFAEVGIKAFYGKIRPLGRRP